MADYVGAIDQGTTSTRFMIFDHSGNEVARHQLEHEQILPRSGWVEHDPVEIWERTKVVIDQALENADADGTPTWPRSGITNQRETDGRVGQDHRPRRTTTRSSGRTPAPTGSPPGSSVTATATRSGTRRGCRRRRTSPAARSSGSSTTSTASGRPRRRATRSSATPTLADVAPHRRHRRRRARHRPDQRQPHHADGPRDPRVGRRAAGDLRHPARRCCRRSSRRRPRRASAPRSTDGPFGGEVPLTGILGDQQAATVGQVCFAPGEAKNTYGTGNFMLLNTGTELVRSKAGLLTTVGYKFGDAGHRLLPRGLDRGHRLGGPVAARPARASSTDAARVRVAGPARSRTTAASYFVPAFSGLFAPYWRRTRAARSSGSPASTPTRTWPGPRSRRSATRAATSPRPWRRTPACTSRCSRSTAASPPTSCACRSRPTCSACPVSRPVVAETTALGAAYAAGLAVGFWRTPTSCARTGTSHKRWEPDWDAEQREAGYAGWKKAVEQDAGLGGRRLIDRAPSGHHDPSLSPGNAQPALDAMAGDELDVLVIGGGVVGAGAALDAAPGAARSAWWRPATSRRARRAGPAS